MPFVDIQNCSIAEIRYTQDGQNCEITQAFYWTGTPPSAGELQVLCQGIATVLVPYLRNMMSNFCVFREVYARNYHVQAAQQATYVFPANTTGNRTGNPLAANEACGIIRRTGFTGRSNRGRNSISGFVQDDVDHNTLTQQLLQLVIQLAGAMLTTYLSGRFTPGVASRTNHTIIPLLGTAVNNSIIDSQKTRLPQHGA